MSGAVHVVPGGPDPAVGALGVRDSELVDVAVEGIGHAAHVAADAEGGGVEVDGQRVAHLSDASAVQAEALVVGAGVLVIGADDVAPAAVPRVPAISYCSRFSGPKRYQEKPPL
jgi:hypothetical protein